MIVGLPLQELRHTRAVQEILEEGRLEGLLEGRQQGRLEGRQQGRLEGRQEGRLEGRQEGLEAGRQQEAAALAIRLLTRRLGTLDVGRRERLSSLTLQQLEQLAEDLLDFTGPADLQAWFELHLAD